LQQSSKFIRKQLLQNKQMPGFLSLCFFSLQLFDKAFSTLNVQFINNKSSYR